MAFEDNFKGDTAALLGSIEALLNLAAVNALVPPVPAMPLQLLQSAAARLSTPAEESSDQADGRQPFEDHPKLAAWIEKLANRRIENFSHASWCAFLGELNAALNSHAMLVELERREAVRQTEARLLAEVQRDEAIRDRNGHADHVLRMAQECEAGLAALTEIDECWEACGLPGNRGKLSISEQVGALSRDLDAAEDRLQEVERALTTKDEPEDYAPSLEQRARDLMGAYLLNQAALARRPAAPAEARSEQREGEP